MAAGMGSRYGGLKQIEGIGPNDEAIIEYSIYDAMRSGFDEVVFIIRKDIEEDFRKTILSRIRNDAPIRLVFQDMYDLPEGFKVPEGRQKPWGTAHAIWSARNHIHNPFLAVNADDFYGRGSYATASEFLKKSAVDSTEYGLIAYYVRNTLSEYGGVTRAVCSADSNDYLREIYEVDGLENINGKITFKSDNPDIGEITAETLVSMNMWAFTPLLFQQLSDSFRSFLEKEGDDLRSEFLIPTVIHQLILENKASVKVLSSNEKWIGMTYKEDKPKVKELILKMMKEGKYPEKLWQNDK